MIEISGQTVELVRTVFRLAGIGKRPGGEAGPQVRFVARPESLSIRAQADSVALAYQLPLACSPAEFVVPAAFLKEITAGRQQTVSFDIESGNQVVARWTAGGVPQSARCSQPKRPHVWPLPEPLPQLAPIDASFLRAFDAAADCCDSDPTRYALMNVQLHAARGQVVATDGRQLLAWGRFEFPWSDNLLVPGNQIFRHAAFEQAAPVQIGRTDDWFILQVGPWTVGLKIEKTGSFPKWETNVWPTKNAVATVRLSPGDATFLASALGRLPRPTECGDTVAVELNGHVAVQARDDADHVTELRLTNSHRLGEALTFLCDRRLLGKALGLGFRDVYCQAADKAFLCDDGQRQYVWMPFSNKHSVPPATGITVLDSPAENTATATVNAVAMTLVTAAVPLRKRRFIPSPIVLEIPMPQTEPKAEPAALAPKLAESTTPETPADLNSPIAQAEALRTLLRDAAGKAGNLVAALRKQRKQGRLMKATLDSIKELQRVAG